MTEKEYLVMVGVVRGSDIYVTCEDEADLRLRSANLGKLWAEAIRAERPYEQLVHFVGDHGTHTIPAPFIHRIEPCVRTRKTNRLETWDTSSKLVHEELHGYIKSAFNPLRDGEES